MECYHCNLSDNKIVGFFTINKSDKQQGLLDDVSDLTFTYKRHNLNIKPKDDTNNNNKVGVCENCELDFIMTRSSMMKISKCSLCSTYTSSCANVKHIHENYYKLCTSSYSLEKYCIVKLDKKDLYDI